MESSIIGIVFCSIIDIQLVVMGRAIILSIAFLVPLVWSWGPSLLGRPRTRSWLFILWWSWRRFRARTGPGTRLPWFWAWLRTWSWMRSFTTWTSGMRTAILLPWWPWVTLTSPAWWAGMWSGAAITRWSGTGPACSKQTKDWVSICT